MNINKISASLKDMRPLPEMEPEIFSALKKLLPMPVIMLFVTNKTGQFALIQKVDKSNGWALPAGYLGLGEDFKSACQRISRKYLGVKVSNIIFFKTFNLTEKIHGKGNGHAVALLFKCSSSSRAGSVNYFKEIPKSTLRHYKFIINKVKKV